MEIDNSWVLDFGEKNAELYLKIQPLNYFSLSARNSEYVSFCKIPSKNAITGILQTILGIKVDAKIGKYITNEQDEQFKLLYGVSFTEHMKKCLTLNKMPKFNRFVPVLDSHYEIEKISYPSDFEYIVDYSKELVHRGGEIRISSSSIGPVILEVIDGYGEVKKRARLNKSTSEDKEIIGKLRESVPRYYLTGNTREYARCVGEQEFYVLKLSCTETMAKKLRSKIESGEYEAPFLGLYENVCLVDILDNVDNLKFEDYNFSYSFETIQDVIDNYYQLSIYERYGFTLLYYDLLELFNKMPEGQITNNLKDAIKNKQAKLEDLSPYIIKILEHLKNETKYVKYTIDEINKRVLFRFNTESYEDSKIKPVNDYGGHVITSEERKVDKSIVDKSIDDLIKLITDRNYSNIEYKQYINHFYTKDINRFRNDYQEVPWILCVCSLITSFTKFKFYTTSQVGMKGKFVYIPDLSFENMLEYRKSILRKLEEDYNLFLVYRIKDNDKLDDKCNPIAVYRNINELINTRDIANKFQEKYANTVNINYYLGRIIEELGNRKEKLKIALKNCHWYSISSGYKTIIKLDKEVQSFLLDCGAHNIHRDISFPDKIQENKKNFYLQQYEKQLISLLCNPNLDKLVNLNNFLMNRSISFKSQFTKPIINYIMNNTINYLNHEEIIAVMNIGDTLSSVAYQLACKKNNVDMDFWKNNNDSKIKDYVINSIFYYLKSFKQIINNSSNLFDFASSINEVYMKFKLNNVIWNDIQKIDMGSFNEDKMNEFKKIVISKLICKIFKDFK